MKTLCIADGFINRCELLGGQFAICQELKGRLVPFDPWIPFCYSINIYGVPSI